jgi:hypothetical protein
MEELLAGVATGGLSTLIGTALGAVSRLATAWLQYRTQERDQAHEREMTKLLTEREQKLSDLRVREASVAGELKVDETWAQALRDAVGTQKTGVGWVDAISATVRPALTYWWMILLSVFKASALWILADSQGWKTALTYAWSADDQAILAAIISFWFLDRTLRKKGM